MNYETLEKLAKNPHYKLSAKQVAMLEQYRRERYLPPVKHSTSVPKHSTAFREHNPKLEEQKDAKAR